MKYVALASDYDGTLATDGRVDESIMEALRRFRASGRRLLMVTGRELPDLQSVFAHLDEFDLVVAENGALLYDPKTGARTPLAPPPPPSFVEALRARGVGPVSVGDVIVATWEPHESAVLAVIKEMGLELEVIFNKGAVMVLPSGVNKGTGLRAALGTLGLSEHAVVGVGDAENDHSLLKVAGLGVAVANAIPALKDRADLVVQKDHGAGVVEVIERMLANDLSDVTLKARETGA